MKLIFLLITVCGLVVVGAQAQPKAIDGRIVGGEKSPIMYPYQVSLQIRRANAGGGGFFGFMLPANFSHNCGGSIMNEHYIVTAAHCINGYDLKRLSVFAGAKNLKDEQNAQRTGIDSCVIHPEYVELNNSDIAVCKLSAPLKFNDNVAAISIDTSFVGGGENCILSGWGFTTMIRGFPAPLDLQRANLKTITNDECNKRGHDVGKREICTFTRFGQGACGGDSGGPLACNGKLVGIVSYGSLVCAVSMPDVYTRASEYADWVNSQIN